MTQEAIQEIIRKQRNYFYTGATLNIDFRITALKKLRVRYPIPVQVVTRPLKRCIQTASLLFPGIPYEC